MAGAATGQPKLVQQLKARLSGSRPRKWLRLRSGLQGKILAPVGALRLVPRTSTLYSPFCHDVPARYARQLTRHLRTSGRIGEFVSRDEALDIVLAGRELRGNMALDAKIPG